MKHNAFITNQKTKTLKKRIHQLLEYSQELKFLVGFFYFSGWQELFESIRERDDLVIKILVGLDVDQRLGHTLELAATQADHSNDEKTDRFFESLSNALNTEEMDIEAFYQQVQVFVQLLQHDRLMIRKTESPSHAKLYVFKFKDEIKGLTDSRFITGSSNLTRAGISEQNEFNVEIGDYGTEEAERFFDELWADAVPITERPDVKQTLIRFIRNRSQAALVSPFEAYLLVLKTYIDLMQQTSIKPQVERLLDKRGYVNYAYQRDAANQALTVIEHYNGVIIADVVGLGKSIIAGMVAKHLGQRGMILCPPGLMGDSKAKSGWRKYRHDFELYDWEIRSSGDLEKAADYLKEQGDDINVVIVDEAHRFRNQDTQNYEYLSTICRNRIVILLTATPFNNSPADMFSLLKLFIIPGKSKITLDNNLEARFAAYERTFQRLSYIIKNHNSKEPDKRARAESYYKALFEEASINLAKVHRRAQYLAAQIRKVLEPVFIRRNRLDLRNDPTYSREVTQLSTVANPRELFYELTPEQSAFYDEVTHDYFGEDGRFTGAIYQPFTYENRQQIDSGKLDLAGNRAFQQQRNLYDFMRRLLVKRFESSFGSFIKSIENFKRVHERVLQFIEKSGGRYILDRSLLEKIYDADSDEIEQALEEFAQYLQENKTPKNNRIYNVYEFELADEFLQDIRSDLELMKILEKRMQDLNLVSADPKAVCLAKQITDILNKPPRDHEPRRKLIIFSEYMDTVRYLQPILDQAFPEQLLYVDGNLSASLVRQIRTNFDASVKPEEQQDDYQILLTSDKLSEGFDLNRAGAIINYDIPWNPTRVIQRVGRINRIGKKVFDQLHIYNFFPTEQGADFVKSREIAGQKMFLIHNTLGEDAKIFDVDETPTASELYNRINTLPDEQEPESLLTMVRKTWRQYAENYPEIVERIEQLPARIKTAKAFEKNQLVVFQKKGLGFFIQSIPDTHQDKPDVESLLFEDALSLIQCDKDEPRLDPSPQFWPCYKKIKTYTELFKTSKSEFLWKSRRRIIYRALCDFIG
ncbi:MAG: helicase-related protein [candidate division KSB1 bacterium]|nr:helicase-related protein [candidate division KSB1 bacterium]